MLIKTLDICHKRGTATCHAYRGRRRRPMYPDDDHVQSSLEAFADAVSENIGGDAAARYAEEEAAREEQERQAAQGREEHA
jgi:hypothetical protein